ncbi:IS3 family transposase [Nocardia fluminea]|uniref:IS3 family transposase n=1 Tax=Nocardia fluminea TaxID=134984 RepID=UPI003D12C36F
MKTASFLDEYPSAYAAAQAIGLMVDVHPESLRQWILKAQTSPGKSVRDQYRHVRGVESICRVLTEHGIQIAPRTYRKARFRPPSPRDVADANLGHALRGLADSPEQMYGRRKMTRYLRRRGHAAAFCTVDRIMRDVGMNGVVRGRRHRTAISSKDGIRAGDRLNRDFGALAPNLVWVADFTQDGGFNWSSQRFDVEAIVDVAPSPRPACATQGPSAVAC